MEEIQIFPMTSGYGYGAVVHGNFVTVCIGMSTFYAHVKAFVTDGDSQFEAFETIAEAVAWAFAAAQKHLGKPYQLSKIVYWEIRNGYSITIDLTDSGRYHADIFPMWIDSDNYPEMGHPETFSTLDDALDFARNTADETMRADASDRQLVEEIRAAMEANSRWGESTIWGNRGGTTG